MVTEACEQALRVIGWAEFIAHPSRLHPTFSVSRGGELHYDKATVIDLTRSTFLGAVEVKVLKDQVVVNTHSQEQLTHVHQSFLRRLLLLRVTVYHTEISNKYSVETVSIVEDDFALLLNPGHPSIRQHVNYGFQRSLSQIQARRRFCLEVDMSELLLDWYMEVRDAITSCDDIHSIKSRRTRLSISNHTRYNHKLDCSPKWILFLCLCWLMVVPCYTVHRKLTCTDIRVKLKCDVTSAAACPVQNEVTRVHVQCVGAKNYQAV